MEENLIEPTEMQHDDDLVPVPGNTVPTAPQTIHDVAAAARPAASTVPPNLVVQPGSSAADPILDGHHDTGGLSSAASPEIRVTDEVVEQSQIPPTQMLSAAPRTTASSKRTTLSMRTIDSGTSSEFLPFKAPQVRKL